MDLSEFKRYAGNSIGNSFFPPISVFFLNCFFFENSLFSLFFFCYCSLSCTPSLFLLFLFMVFFLLFFLLLCLTFFEQEFYLNHFYLFVLGIERYIWAYLSVKAFSLNWKYYRAVSSFAFFSSFFTGLL